ncbi:MAG: hypothetical protein D6820_11050, partial [Lentisphaerae bacterium]
PLPKGNDPLARFKRVLKNHLLYDYYGANLFRKYGNDYREKAIINTLDRMESWGLNTLGCWSKPAIWAKKRLPFTVFIGYRVRELAEQLPDVWDPRFANVLKRVLAKAKNDPVINSAWNIGFFIFNEVHFKTPASLAGTILASSADQPAKIAWCERLRKKYGQIGELNRVWKTHYRSWEDMLKRKTKVNYRFLKEDAEQCFKDYLDRFFRICSTTCKEYFPNHLYLGSRLHGKEHPLVLAAADRYCDVISYNLYLKSLKGWTGPLPNLHRPVMATEWHFGALDRGIFHTGLQPASNQEDRAEHYYEYVKSALLNRLIIGTHWFQYLAQPCTGRGDGENYQIGMVDVTDTPYPELIRAIRKIGHRLYEIRFYDQDPGSFQ